MADEIPTTERPAQGVEGLPVGQNITAADKVGGQGGNKPLFGDNPDTRVPSMGVVGEGTVADNAEGGNVGAAGEQAVAEEATTTIPPSPAEDVENEALRKEHPSLLTKDEAQEEAETQELRADHPKLLIKDEVLAIAGETKDRRSSGAYHRGEAALNDELDGIQRSTMSDDEKRQAEEDVNRRRSELRAMHGVNEKWIPPSVSAEDHRRAGNGEDSVAEKVEQWALVVKRSPELIEAGWDIHKVINESYEAVMARQNADGVLMVAAELREDLEGGKINLVDLIQQTGRNQIFGKNIDPVLAMKLKELLSGDKAKTIQQVEDEFLEEVQKAFDSYDDIARRQEDRVRSLSQGKVPK